MGEFPDDEEKFDYETRELREEEHALSPDGIAEQNHILLERYRDFRRAADAVAAAWRERPEVKAVALIGSVAAMPWKEIPRFSPYRRAMIALWHECRDVDLAAWLARTEDLGDLRRAKNRALRDLREETGFGVASHQVDVFVLEPGTDRYLGRLCQFNRCPKGKRECRVEGCGTVPFLQQHEGFRWRPSSLEEGRTVRLYKRATGRIQRAADLSLADGEDSGGGDVA